MPWGRKFPYGTRGPKPPYVICVDCGGDGWGPMLRTSLWNLIAPANHNRYFLCENCMESRLLRKLKPGDLRDCPMNYFHPCYLNNGVQ